MDILKKKQNLTFPIYFSAVIALSVSESLYDMAFATYAYDISRLAIIGGITYALGFFAEIIVSLLAGGLLDNYPKKRIYAISISLKLLAFIIVTTLAYTNEITVYKIWFFAFIIDALHHITKLANVVSLVDLCKNKSELAKYNGYLAAIASSSMIIGPIFSAAMIGIFGSMESIFICMVLQIFSLIMMQICFRRIATPTESITQPKNPDKSNILSSLLSTTKSYKTIFSNQFWTSLFIINGIITFVIGSLILMFVPFIKASFNIDNSQIGYFFSASAIGGIIAGLLLQHIHRRFSLKIVISGSIFITAITSSILPFSGNFWLALPTALAFQFGVTAFYRSTAVAIQMHAPRDEVGAFYSASDAFSRVFGLMGVIVAGIIFDKFGYGTLYIGSGLILLIIALIANSRLDILNTGQVEMVTGDITRES